MSRCPPTAQTRRPERWRRLARRPQRRAHPAGWARRLVTEPAVDGSTRGRAMIGATYVRAAPTGFFCLWRRWWRTAWPVWRSARARGVRARCQRRLAATAGSGRFVSTVTRGCSRARGLGQPFEVTELLLTRDGRHVYLVTDSGITAFARRRANGTLVQLAGTAAGASLGRGCAHARGNFAPGGAALTPTADTSSPPPTRSTAIRTTAPAEAPSPSFDAVRAPVGSASLAHAGAASRSSPGGAVRARAGWMIRAA